MPCKATTEISSSSKNINNTVRLSRHLSISYDYGFVYGCFLFLIFIKTAAFQNFSGLFVFNIYKKNRSSHPYMFLGKGVLKICSTFTGQHPCLSAISIKLLKICSKFTGEHQCRSAIAIKLLATLLKSYFDMGFLL